MILPDAEVCYRAVQGRDPRFDGWFVTAVRTTGIYCRPSCPAITPRRDNVSFHPSAAAAQRAGYRACKRCRPDAAPGSPEWDVRGDLAGRALRLIADGLVEREGVPGLARRLGYSERQVHRTLVAEVGAGPLALARSQRARTARVLLETTDLPITGIAFAAGFASVRQFNDTVQQVFATSPGELRRARAAGRRDAVDAATATADTAREGDGSGPTTLVLRLAYRAPMQVLGTLRFLGAHAVPGLESWDGTTFTRVIDAPGGPALVALSDGGTAVHCTARLHDVRDLTAVVARVRRLLDLDADPVAVDHALGSDPALAPLIARRPGLRSPGAVDGAETAIRTVVGQQISLAGARTVLGRIVAEHGRVAVAGEPWRLFPSVDVLAAADPETLPMPRARGRTVQRLAQAVAGGSLVLDPGTDRDALRTSLLSLKGIGPWTADYLRMRVAADPDVLLTTDLGVRASAARRGLDLTAGRPDWAPWRSYVTHHIWADMFADGWT